MNIFVLDENPWVCAEYHCDKHVPKMILESAQMLSTVLGGPYKPTHKKHPCTLWVAESRANAEWLWLLADALNCQFKDRFGHERNHKSWDAIEPSWYLCKSLPEGKLTPFVQAMPDEFKRPDPVEAYRAYYHSKPFAKWRYTNAPYWWTPKSIAV